MSKNALVFDAIPKLPSTAVVAKTPSRRGDALPTAEPKTLESATGIENENSLRMPASEGMPSDTPSLSIRSAMATK